ncbi:MAG: protease complex subunit PrcB family protein [Clostridiales bacterium]|nr:protease complex subunit PrcB family protein [Clostridiales bacterium]
MVWWKWGKALLVMTLLVMTLGGCSIEEKSGTKIRDLDYEIVEEDAIPEELLGMIAEKKEADFKLTYETGESRYIARGYGEQATGGYSIRVKDCYLASNAILIDTELLGPRKGETTSPNPSYPYIVLKIEKSEQNIIFE